MNVKMQLCTLVVGLNGSIPQERGKRVFVQGYGTQWRLNVQESSDDSLIFSNAKRARVPSHCVLDLTDVTNRARKQSSIVLIES